VLAVLRRDYPGYRDRVPGHEAEFAASTDSVRAVARTSDHYSVCIPALKRVTAFFRDAHLLVWQAAPPTPPAPPAPTSAAPAAGPPQHPADDPDRPTLRFADESTAVLRLPTLDVEYKPAIDTLVTANLARLRVAPYLIVDLRGNGGGCTCSYDAIGPLLYTDPIRWEGTDVLASPANTDWYRTWFTAHAFELSESDKATRRAVLSRMDTHPNQFVELYPATVLRRDTVYGLPRKVAVLVDRGCASSCEDFVLEARQSRKVAVLGVENTSGTHDYGEVRSLWLPGWRRLRVPTARSRGERIDFIGIAPAVRIPKDTPDAVEWARRYLHAAGGRLE
jgi:hypothetical protein